MHARKDSGRTRRSILEAACREFAEKGYREATHAEICRRAGVNIAAINYHFGSKAQLYRAAWTHAREEADRLYPINGGVGEEQPPAERLRGIITALVRRRDDYTRLGHLHRIRMCEMFDPTGLLDDLVGAHIKATRAHTKAVIKALLGPGASERDVALCESSVVSQCLFRPHGGRPFSPPARSSARSKASRAVIDHITRFSLAGIAAIRSTRSCTKSHRGGKRTVADEIA